MARHLARCKPPTVSSTRTPLRTNNSSPFSSFRRVLLLLTSKPLVSAMSFTQRLKSCSNSIKPSRVTPAAWLCKPRSSCVAFGRCASGKPSRCRRRAAAEMRASPPLSLAKSASASTVSPSASTAPARNAKATARSASPARAPRATWMAATAFLQRISIGASLTFNRIRRRRVSKSGPELALFTSPALSARIFFVACATACAAEVASRAASSMACNGLSSLAADSAEVSASAAAAAFSARAEVLSASSVASVLMRLARSFSAASSLRKRSASNFSAWPFCASETRFFSCECKDCALLARMRSFMSSAFASARGPRPPFLDSSSALFLRWASVEVAQVMASSMAASSFRMHASYGEKASM
mmetsp:Transcript_92937/g.267370  ORF Transcript_92937/g.267370 Transcript_92937/m.267370 type:complete len:359 (+) Transcript_92937:960-2036(+)